MTTGERGLRKAEIRVRFPAGPSRTRACSSAGERCLGKAEVAGANPAWSIKEGVSRDPGVNDRLSASVALLRERLLSLRVGRPTSSLLDGVRVEHHGTQVPLEHLAIVNADHNALLVRPFDLESLRLVERAINSAGLGLTAQSAKTTIRVPIPPLSQERRHELVNAAKRYGEDAKVALRNVRRDELKKASGLPEDHKKTRSTEIDKAVKDAVSEVDELVARRAAEIMS